MLLAALVLGPVLLSRGFALVGDMVFVPQQPWKDAWLGVDGSAPRAVPGDAVVSTLSHVVPGDVLQKAILFAVVAGGAWGVVRLVAEHGWRAQLVASALYVWNPYVYERLAIGHWALLCGYAALPWVVLTARSVRDGRLEGLLALVPPLALAAFMSPTGGVLAVLVALAVVLGRPRAATVASVVGLGVAVNLPWILPGLLFPGGLAADMDGVRAFAARADTPLGTLGSLLSLGGLWKSSVAAPGREVWLLALLGTALVLGGVASAVHAAYRGHRTEASLTAVAVLGLLLAWLPATAAVPLFEWLGSLPGGGLLRDSQKWVAPLALLAVVGLARLVAVVEKWLTARRATLLGVSLLPLLPLAALPGLAWGQFGRLEPVGYPAEWTLVAERLGSEPGAGRRVVVLPFEIYRRFPWNENRALLDPAPRFFPGEVVVNDALRVGGGRVVAGEDPVAGRVAAAMPGPPRRLAELLEREQVAWLLVEKRTPGAADLPVLPGEVVHDGDELTLLRVSRAESPAPPGWRTPVLVIDGFVLLGVLAASGAATFRRVRGILVSEGDAMHSGAI